MGSYDVPPLGAPKWLIPLSTAFLASGIFFWLVTYVLMTRRSLATKSSPIPLIPLGINLAWEVVYAIFVTDSPLERLGFAAWLAFDVPVVWATLRTSPTSAKRTLLLSFVAGAVANAAFAHWWLQEAGRGYGDKTGKTWRGIDDRDTTELAWWSAGAAQMLLSVGCVVQVLQKGHSGGQSYGIWLLRFLGTMMGLPVTCGLLWWYWPSAHGFIFHPASYIIMGATVVCDIAYPVLLASVRRTEVVMADGRIVAADEDKKKQ